MRGSTGSGALRQEVERVAQRDEDLLRSREDGGRGGLEELVCVWNLAV